ncbi:TPA: hypothetical protein ACJKFB_000164 [Neisseria meningitidis]
MGSSDSFKEKKEIFENGTCVILLEPEKDLAKQAKEMLSKWGKVQIGTPSADFGIITLDSGDGYAVSCHHPEIFTLILKEEGLDEDFKIGIEGRSHRDCDAEEPKVIHIEDKRTIETP